MKKIIDYPFPRRLKLLRLEADYTQEEVGIKAGLPLNSCNSRMNTYELGRHEAEYSIVKKISNVFHVDPAYFYAENESVAELIRNWSKQNLPKN